MRRTTRGSRRWPLRSAPIASPVIARRDDKRSRLEIPDGVDGDDLTRIVEGVWLARDLINTPANDMGPPDLEYAARKLGDASTAPACASIVGDDLLTENFPLIHAVGRARRTARRG